MRAAREPYGRAVRQRAPAVTSTVKGAVEVIYAEDGWHVTWEGDPATDSIHDSRIAAIVVAHERASEARCDLVIRGWSGAIREHVSYRDDPLEQHVIYRQPELRRALATRPAQP